MVNKIFNRLKQTYHDYPKTFWVLLLGTFIDRLGGFLLFPYFAIYIRKHFQVGMTEVGFIFTMFSVGSLLGGTLGGTDREVLGETWLSYCNYSYGNYHIESIPEEVDVLQQIKRFEFNDVHLKTLPDSLCKMHSIEELLLARNEIENLPACIGELKKMVYLDVSDNAIAKFPQSVGELESLLMLRVENNKLTNLPNSIGELKKLDRLFLANNPIGRLPESLQECTSLETLDISGTNITPPKWLEEMPSLKKVIGAPELTLYFQKHLENNEYGQMQIVFRDLFDQDLTEEEVAHKEGGMIGDEALPLGQYVWDKKNDCIEYYIS